MFLYRLKGVTRQAFTDDHRQVIAAAGLANLFFDTLEHGEALLHFIAAETTDGVVIVGRTEQFDQPEHVGYYPQRQEWIDCGPYELGIDHQCPTTPDMLQRRNQVAGDELKLADGNWWHCPVIRRFGPNQYESKKEYEYGISQLPSFWGINPETKKFGEILKPDYRRFWDLSGDIFDWFTVIDSEAITKQDAFGKAVEVLSLNYRLGIAEASALRLIDSENYKEIFETAIDGALLKDFMSTPEFAEHAQNVVKEALAEKKSDDSPLVDASTSPGPADI